MRAMLKAVTLEDFGPIAGKHTLTFDGPGTYAICAPNGKGKSHVVAGIKIATSPGTELEKPMAAFVNGYGLLEGSSYSQVMFDVGGEDLLVTRTFTIADRDKDLIRQGLERGEMPKAKGKWSLKYKGSHQKAEADVMEQMRSLFGIDNRIQEDAVFVMQNQAGAALRATPAQRSKIVQYLCGAEICQKAAELATQRLNLLQVIDLTDDIAILKGKVANLTQQIQDSQVSMSLSAAESLTAEGRDALQATIDAGTKQAGLRPIIVTERASLQKDVAALEAAQRIINATEMDQQSLQGSMTPQYTAELEKARSAVAAAASLESLIAQKTLTYSDKNALVQEASTRQPPIAPKVTAEAIAEVDKNLQFLRSTYSSSKEFLDVFGKTGACPTCGSKPSNAEQLLAQHRATVEALVGQIKETDTWVDTARKQLQRYATDQATYQAWETGWRQRMAAVEKRLETFVTVPDAAGDVSGAKAIVNQHEGLARTMQLNLQTIATQQKVAENLQLSIQGRQQALERYEASMTPLVLDVDVDKAKNALAVARTAQATFAKLEGTLGALTKQLALDQQELDRKALEQDKNSAKIRQRKFLEGVKTVLHHTAIPHDRSLTYLRNMNEIMAHYCGVIHTPFRLAIDMETFSFMAHMDGGYPQPVAHLSGGQSTLACWVWHLALYHKHGGQIGFMVLDEPTYGLDARNLDNVADGVRYLTKYCHGAGVQLILVTHEPALASVFDRSLVL
jgi:DNA repair exonuclease SbcCD ATPase subunit